MTSETFDYVIVGAGSAGCIVAARLSENPSVRVLLIEAGGGDGSPWFRVPIGYARSYYDPAVNWMYWSEPEAQLEGRKIYVPRGKVVGGSGAINAMIFVRGARQDFDDWAAAGNPGWDYQSALPFFRKLETSVEGGSYHGDSGPIHVTSMRDQAHPVTRNFLDACAELGLPRTDDFNGAQFEGAGIYDINTKDGQRCSSGFAYLRPALKRPNLKLMRNAAVSRVLFDETMRATGVELRRGGQKVTVNAAREVILCAGAIGTPKLLQLSGIGDSGFLQSVGVKPVLHAPAVGKNLQDHLCASFYYRANVPTLNDQLSGLHRQAWLALRYLATRRGPLALSVNQAGAFLRGAPDAAQPNIQLYFNPLSYRIPDNPKAGLKAEPYSGFLLAFNPCRPTSVGTVEISGPDENLAPVIRPNFLTTAHDIDEMLQGARLARRIMDAPSLKAITAEEMPPSAGLRDDELLYFCRGNSGSIYHPCGTARMGGDPANSVVDTHLRVHGARGLRVIDASIFPNITSGNINAPTMMVAEKGAELIRG